MSTEDDEKIDRALAWADYHKEYGVHPDSAHREYCAFVAGWDAARGRIDLGGVQR